MKAKLGELVLKRDQLIEDMELARQEGDLAENSAYHNLREQVNLVNSQIDILEEKLGNAQIISSKNQAGVIDINSRVMVEVSSQTKNFEIVGNGDVDPLTGKISYQSPIGSALMGKQKGDTVRVETPKGGIEYKIIEIE